MKMPRLICLMLILSSWIKTFLPPTVCPPLNSPISNSLHRFFLEFKDFDSCTLPDFTGDRVRS